MRRRLLPFFLLGLMLFACTASDATPPSPTTVPPTAVQQAVVLTPTLTALTPTTEPASATPSVEPTATTASTPTTVATSTPQIEDLALSADNVFLHPVPDIYAGDIVSVYILAQVPETVEPNDVTVRVEVADDLSLQGALNSRNLAGNAIGLFAWAWKTEGKTGEHELTVTLDPEDTITAGDENPDNNQVVLHVPVLPTNRRPAREALHSWVTADTNCCRLHVINGTAAHRDLEELKVSVDNAVQQASEQLGVQPESKFDLYMIERVIGQGGYASSNVVISYLDRNYAGGGLHEVLVHETVHLLDRQFAPNRIPFLAEGLAVTVAGGHYKQENIEQRVKALRETNLYVPLADIIDNFYDHQHEIAYLEAAGFISYLVKNYGWEKMRTFYSDVVPQEGVAYSTIVDQKLQIYFDRTLTDVESAWLAYLNDLPRDAGTVGDLLTTIRYYEIMRDYQLRYDPTAHFLQAWLPYPQELEQRQITADVTRHPSSEINVTLEVMLYAVDQALAEGDYNRANVLLDSIERAIANNGLFVDPLGAHYREIVAKLMSLGFEVHQVELRGNEALVHVTEGRRIHLRPVTLALKNQNWVLLN